MKFAIGCLLGSVLTVIGMGFSPNFHDKSMEWAYRMEAAYRASNLPSTFIDRTLDSQKNALDLGVQAKH